MPEASAPDLAVVCNHSPSRDRAATLARQLQCPLLVGVDVAQLSEPDFVVLCDADGLGVQQAGLGAAGPVRAEFAAGSVEHRRRFGGGKGQMIAKAIGVKAGVYPRVLDLTAGLGKDGFVLASLGCRVTLVERSLLVYQLLEDGLARAQVQARDPELVATLERIDLVHGDGCEYLNSLTPDQSPEVVYLDPMFPEREKSAQVKKEMRTFHQLVGRDEDAAGLLEAALARCIYRVVVKRPRKAPFLGGQAPSYQLTGKSSRFDVYALKKLPGKTG